MTKQTQEKTWVMCVKCGLKTRVYVERVEEVGRNNFICESFCKGGLDDKI